MDTKPETILLSKDSEMHHHLDAVVCGGGPAGLLSSIMLAQRFAANAPNKRTIHVLEASSTPPLSLNEDNLWNTNDALARHYTLGVFGRGRRALEHFGVWNSTVESIAQVLVGSQSWRSNTTSVDNSNNATLFADQGREEIYALPRDKLVSALYQHIREEYPSEIVFHFGKSVMPLDFEHSNGTSVLLKVIDEEHQTKGLVTTDFLIGSDGAARTVANKIEQVEQTEWKQKSPFQRLISGHRPFAVTRFDDTNPRVYKTIPVQLPRDWRRDIGYSASNSNDKDRRYTIVSLPSNTEGGLCAVLLMKEGDPMAQPNTDPKELRAILDQHLPVFSNLVDDSVVAAVAQKKPSNFPFFRYAGPRLHKGYRTVILGDACHSVKPYNGLGVNSAFEDVHILSDILERNLSRDNPTMGDQTTSSTTSNNDNFYWKSVVESFSKTRAKDCKAMVKLSRAGDRSSRIGFLSFLIPLLVDAFFHKVFPTVFTPPTPGLIHNVEYRFHQVAVRKRWERLVQACILTSGAILAFRGALALVRTIAVSVGQPPARIAVGMSLSVFAAALGRKRLVHKS